MLPVVESAAQKSPLRTPITVCAISALLYVVSNPVLAAPSATIVPLEEIDLFSQPRASSTPPAAFPRATPVNPRLSDIVIMGTPVGNGQAAAFPPLTPPAPAQAGEQDLDEAAAATAAPQALADSQPFVPFAAASEDRSASVSHRIAKKPGMLERWYLSLFGKSRIGAENHQPAASFETAAALAKSRDTAVSSLPLPPPALFLQAEAVSMTSWPEATESGPSRRLQEVVQKIEELPPIYLSPPDVIVSAAPPPEPLQVTEASLTAGMNPGPVVAQAQRVDDIAAPPMPDRKAAEPDMQAFMLEEPAPSPDVPATAPQDMAAMTEARLNAIQPAAAPAVTSDLINPSGRNFDPTLPRPTMADGWRGARGQTLRQVLEEWCNRARVRLYWNTQFDYPLQASVMIDDNFENAVRLLLDGFAVASPQPIGRLHRQSQIGESVLIIQTRGNRYEN